MSRKILSATRWYHQRVMPIHTTQQIDTQIEQQTTKITPPAAPRTWTAGKLTVKP
jgi:hypothetical protein